MKRLTATLLILCGMASVAFGVTASNPDSGPPKPAAVAKPVIDIDTEFAPTNVVLFRGRQAELFKPEDELCVWREQFPNEVDYQARFFSGSNATFSSKDGKGTYTATSTSGAGLLASVHLRHAQYTSVLRIESQTPATGTYNDQMVGIAVCTSATSDTISDTIMADYRRTEGKNQVFLRYTKAGAPTETSPVTITERPTDGSPLKLIHVLNHNSHALAIEQNGAWKILANQEIPIDGTGYDLEDQAVVARLRPALAWQADAPATIVLQDWSVRCMGSLGEREHMVARFQDGRPITDKSGKYVYVSCDDCGPTTASTASPTANSAFMRNRHCVWLYDPATGRRVKSTACLSAKIAGRVFGTQEGYVMYDEGRGEWHYYWAEWNVSGGAATKIYHAKSATENYLEAGDKVFEESENAQINLSGLAGFNGQSVYSFNVWRKPSTGVWYATGIVTAAAAPTRRCYLIHDDNPEFSSPTLDWIISDESNVSEGGYFWHVGANTFVAYGCALEQVLRNMDGTNAKRFLFPGSGGYEQFMDCLPWVKGDKTQYQLISFSDVSYGEEYTTGANVIQKLAFGPRIVLDAGTFTGKQWTTGVKAEAVK